MLKSFIKKMECYSRDSHQIIRIQPWLDIKMSWSLRLKNHWEWNRKKNKQSLSKKLKRKRRNLSRRSKFSRLRRVRLSLLKSQERLLLIKMIYLILAIWRRPNLLLRKSRNQRNYLLTKNPLSRSPRTLWADSSKENRCNWAVNLRLELKS